MQIIAMGDMALYLKENIVNYTNPSILISTQSFKGCAKCNSGTNAYFATLIEKTEILDDSTISEVKEHKFPFPIYYQESLLNPMPEKIVLGTRESSEGLELVIQKLIY